MIMNLKTKTPRSLKYGIGLFLLILGLAVSYFIYVRYNQHQDHPIFQTLKLGIVNPQTFEINQDSELVFNNYWISNGRIYFNFVLSDTNALEKAYMIFKLQFQQKGQSPQSLSFIVSGRDDFAKTEIKDGVISYTTESFSSLCGTIPIHGTPKLLIHMASASLIESVGIDYAQGKVTYENRGGKKRYVKTHEFKIVPKEPKFIQKIEPTNILFTSGYHHYQALHFDPKSINEGWQWVHTVIAVNDAEPVGVNSGISHPRGELMRIFSSIYGNLNELKPGDRVRWYLGYIKIPDPQLSTPQKIKVHLPSEELVFPENKIIQIGGATFTLESIRRLTNSSPDDRSIPFEIPYITKASDSFLSLAIVDIFDGNGIRITDDFLIFISQSRLSFIRKFNPYKSDPLPDNVVLHVNLVEKTHFETVEYWFDPEKPFYTFE